MSERNEAYAAVQEFIEQCKAKDGPGWAYSTGYLGSMLERLIYELPATRRDQAIQQLRQQTQQIIHDRTLTALKK